jgi:PIN domain nuclease of toxin-antitoxin system
VVKLLLDSSTLIWSLDDPSRLSSVARREITDETNAVLVSVASAWEIAIKASIGKLRGIRDLSSVLSRFRFELLPISINHVETVQVLPFHHRDPFDRMLVAQAQVEGARLVSNDPAFAHYAVATLW